MSGQQPPAAGAAPTAAPQGGGRGQQGPQVVSPEVNADRTVTLRLLAPKATQVTVTGEILNGAQPTAMTKGDDGIWTATMPAVPPDIYTYAFNIDGVNTPDPRNPWVKLVSGTGLASQVEVPGDGLQFWDSKPVPHGLLQIVTYESKALGATRQAYVYTPPDYNRSNTRYPVLYLLHGGGDLDPGWSMTGRAHIIMDNLIAEKKARPMVVVMPVARGGGSLGSRPERHVAGDQGGRQRHAWRGRAGGPGRALAARAGGPAGTGDAAAVRAGLHRRSDAARREDLPRLDASGGSRHRRAVGRRRGDGQHRVQPARAVPYVVIMSAGAGQNVEASYPKFFANGAAAAKQWKLLWLGAGDADFALNGTKALDEVLNKHGVKHPLTIRPGYRHEWRLWRQDLWEFAPLLFQEGAKGTQ